MQGPLRCQKYPDQIPAIVSGQSRRRWRSCRLARPRRRRRSLRGPLSGQAQRGLHARPRRYAGEIQSQLQQFLRVQHQQAHRRRRSEDPTLDGQARRPGREGTDDRHQFSDQGDGARGASLSPPLRRSVVDGDPLDRLPPQETGRVRQAAVLGVLRAVRDLPRQEDGAGPALVHAVALCRGPDDGGSDQRPRLHRHRRLWQAARQGSGRADPAGCPWKYGFKSIKSIVRISFVDKRPETFWEALGPEEYGFWANVNPAVPHPRWSQSTENFLNDGQQRPTLIYNGYGEQVASLYNGLQKEPLFM